MVNKCAAPKCNSVYASNEKKQVAKFNFPLKNTESKKQSIRFVNRRDWIAKKHSVLCELHFEEMFTARWKMYTTVIDESCTHCLSPKTFKETIFVTNTANHLQSSQKKVLPRRIVKDLKESITPAGCQFKEFR